ncbi:MAG TPA: hypothetical protein VFY40_23400 [Blastocatellia bacterium]|nr:hypothetical protein [Blastocatellia bacterium]
MEVLEVSFDQVFNLAQRLSLVDQIKLIARLGPAVEKALDKGELPGTPQRPNLYGALSDLGPAPSSEDIDEIRREMWANFPREDI